MHIAFLTNEYPPLPTGGIGTSIRNLARALVRHGHQVTVIGWGADRKWEDQGIQIRFFPGTRIPKMGWLLNRQRAARALNELADRQSLDVVEAPDWCGLSAGMRLQAPVVIRCNGSATYFADLLAEKVDPRVRRAERHALSSAQKIVAVSAFTARRTERLFGLRQSISVIPNGIDADQFAPTSAADVEPDTILYLGSLVRKKGVLDLPLVLEQVVSVRPNAHLILVGRDCPDKATGSESTWRLIQDALPSRIRDRVEWVGPQPYERVQMYVRQAAVCVFPSYAEAFPLSWLEAMACAKPLVAYDIGWASEAVAHGTSGFLAPAADTGAMAKHLATLLRDHGLAQQIGQAARSRVLERFTSDHVAHASLGLYAEVTR